MGRESVDSTSTIPPNGTIAKGVLLRETENLDMYVQLVLVPQYTSDRLGVGGLSKSFTRDFDYLQMC